MAKKPYRTPELLIGNSKESQVFWGKEIEENLPKPTITEDPAHMSPAALLVDICQYARGAESRGEFLFRTKYLAPIFNYYQENSDDVSWREDKMGNMYVTVGEPNGILHVGHVDTVHADDHSPLQDVLIDEKNIMTLAPVVKHSLPQMKKTVRWVEGNKYDHHYTDYELPPKQTRCLGADDGCAVAIMIYLIAHGVQGTYLFTRGEEIGCVGTHHIMDMQQDETPEFDLTQFMVAVEVDRKGTTEIIGEMSPGITASRVFVKSLAEQLGMGHKYSDKGSITDVGYMAKFIPECVNLAAGYNLQHSDRENTDLNYLDRLGAAMLQVDWENLSVTRPAGKYFEPVKTANRNSHAYRGYNSGGYTGSNYSTPRNSYGDYTKEPSLDVVKFANKFVNSNNFAEEAWIRSNAGFLVEFLKSLNVSPAEMDNIICFGNIQGEDLEEIDIDELGLSLLEEEDEADNDE